MSLKILINLPTNIGDTILALPAIDAVKAKHPACTLTAIVSSQTQEFIARCNIIDKTLLFNKRWAFGQKYTFCRTLRNQFDCIIDFKHSLLPFLLNIKMHTPYIRLLLKKMHRKDENINLVSRFADTARAQKATFTVTDTEREKLACLVPAGALFIATASNSHIKRYPVQHLNELVRRLRKDAPLVLIGAKTDTAYYKEIGQTHNVINLVGHTTLPEVYYLLKERAHLLISVDSSILHLASYIDIPIVALFGPTDPGLYGPWSSYFRVLHDTTCKRRPCARAQCSTHWECMKGISPGMVSEAAYAFFKKNE